MATIVGHPENMNRWNYLAGCRQTFNRFGHSLYGLKPV